MKTLKDYSLKGRKVIVRDQLLLRFKDDCIRGEEQVPIKLIPYSN